MIGLSMDMRSLGDQYFEAAEAIVSLVMNNTHLKRPCCGKSGNPA